MLAKNSCVGVCVCTLASSYESFSVGAGNGGNRTLVTFMTTCLRYRSITSAHAGFCINAFQKKIRLVGIIRVIDKILRQ